MKINRNVIVNKSTIHKWTKYAAGDKAYKIGRRVCFSGAQTNDTDCDYIRYYGRKVKTGNTTTTGLVEFYCGVRGGDSGGPIGSNEVWMGILHGFKYGPSSGYPRCGPMSGTLARFTPAKNVPGALGITTGLTAQTSY